MSVSSVCDLMSMFIHCLHQESNSSYSTITLASQGYALSVALISFITAYSCKVWSFWTPKYIIRRVIHVVIEITVFPLHFQVQ